jgi:hypothetical protein
MYLTKPMLSPFNGFKFTSSKFEPLVFSVLCFALIYVTNINFFIIS